MSRRGLVLFASMSVIWGIPYLFIRVAVAEITPAVLVFLRTAIAAAILLPIALVAGRPAAGPRALALGRRVRGDRDRDPVGAARIRRAAPVELADRAADRRRRRSSARSSRSPRAAPTGWAGRPGSGCWSGWSASLAIVGGDFGADDAVALVQVFVVVGLLRGRPGDPRPAARRRSVARGHGPVARRLRAPVRPRRRAPVAGGRLDERRRRRSWSWAPCARPRRSCCSPP